MRQPVLTLIIVAYWFLACWFPLVVIRQLAPYAVRAGLVTLVIGLVLLLWVWWYEDKGRYAPPFLGWALIFPPSVGIVAGLVWGFMRLLGLF